MTVIRKMFDSPHCLRIRTLSDFGLCSTIADRGLITVIRQQQKGMKGSKNDRQVQQARTAACGFNRQAGGKEGSETSIRISDHLPQR
jgi:hypothetical protein